MHVLICVVLATSKAFKLALFVWISVALEIVTKKKRLISDSLDAEIATVTEPCENSRIKTIFAMAVS